LYYNTGSKINTTVTLSGHIATEIYELWLEGCGDSKLDCCQISHRSQRIYQGLDSIKDQKCSGRLRTFTGDTLAAIIATILEEDRHMTCEEITMESGIPESFFRHVLTEVLKSLLHDNARHRITQIIQNVFIDYK
jgi:hypothetical protein